MKIYEKRNLLKYLYLDCKIVVLFLLDKYRYKRASSSFMPHPCRCEKQIWIPFIRGKLLTQASSEKICLKNS